MIPVTPVCASPALQMCALRILILAFLSVVLTFGSVVVRVCPLLTTVIPPVLHLVSVAGSLAK